MSVSMLGSTAARLRPRRRDAVLSYSAAEEMVLYDGQSHAAISLNLSAAAIWELCDGSNSVDDIIAQLAEAADEGRHVVTTDVQRTLHELHTLNLLVLETEDTGP